MGNAVTVISGRGVALRAAVVLLAATLVACSPSSGPGQPQPSGSGSPQPSASPSSLRAHLELPTRLGNRSQFSDRRMREAALNTLNHLKELIGEPTDALTRVYNGETDADYAVLVGTVAGTVPDQERALDRLFTLFPKVRDVRPVDAGALGGSARCGSGTNDQYWVTVCAWADEISIGTVTFLSLDKRERDRGDEFVAIRSELEFPIPGLPSTT